MQWRFGVLRRSLYLMAISRQKCVHSTGHTTLLRRWINVTDVDSTSQQRRIPSGISETPQRARAVTNIASPVQHQTRCWSNEESTQGLCARGSFIPGIPDPERGIQKPRDPGTQNSRLGIHGTDDLAMGDNCGQVGTPRQAPGSSTPLINLYPGNDDTHAKRLINAGSAATDAGPSLIQRWASVSCLLFCKPPTPMTTHPPRHLLTLWPVQLHCLSSKHTSWLTQSWPNVIYVLARILVQVTIHRRLLIGGDKSEAYDIS